MWTGGAQSLANSNCLDRVRAYRTTSSAPTTRSMAKIPHLFAQRYRPQTDFLCVPSVVSENRPYFTAADIEEGTVVSSLAFAVEDSDRSQFALISSSMFITWQKMIGGRLESRLRFANTLTWNTFPVPELDEKTRKRIIKAGQKVLAARTAPGAFPRGALQPAGYDTRTGEGA